MSDEQEQSAATEPGDLDPSSTSPTTEATATEAAPGAGRVAAPEEIEELLLQAESGIAEAAGDHPGASTSPFKLDELKPGAADGPSQSLDLLDDIELDLRIELGRTMMRLEDVLQLRSGSVVVLDKLAGDPVDIYVNGRLVARGEVLVMNDNFCVRVTELAGSGV